MKKLMMLVIILLIFSCDHGKAWREMNFLANLHNSNWKLVKSETPHTMINSFKQHVILNYVKDKEGNLQEFIREDSIVISNKVFVEVGSLSLKNKTFYYHFNDGTFKSYWMNGNILTTSGYVEKIGDKSDTVKYYFESIPVVL